MQLQILLVLLLILWMPLLLLWSKTPLITKLCEYYLCNLKLNPYGTVRVDVTVQWRIRYCTIIQRLLWNPALNIVSRVGEDASRSSHSGSAKGEWSFFFPLKLFRSKTNVADRVHGFAFGFWIFSWLGAWQTCQVSEAYKYSLSYWTFESWKTT